MLATYRNSLTRKLTAAVAAACLLVVLSSLLGIMILGGLHLEASEAILSTRLNRTLFLLVTAALLLVVAVTLATFLSLNVLLRNPMRRLITAFSAAREGNFLHRLEVTSTDEIGQLAEEFNHLLGRLTELQASQITSELELSIAQRELALKAELVEKNDIIELTNRSLEQRLAELKLLFEMAQVFASTLDLDSLMELLQDRLQGSFHFQSLVILLAEDNALEVRRVWGSEQPAWQPGIKHDPDLGLFGLMSKTGRPVQVDDLFSFERRFAFEEGLPIEGSFLFIPLSHAGKLLGALGFTRPERRAFSEPEIHFLTSLGQQASLAIVNANLYKEKLELSVTDELTQLANRRRMHSRLDLEWNRANRFGGPLSLLMIDIDHFKHYNDVHGHLLGDQALVGVADVLRTMTRKIDTVVRFGGEEFVVILPDQSKEMALKVAEKLRGAVAEADIPRVRAPTGGGITISIGLAAKDEDALSPSELLDRADLALYVAKRSGRNQVRAYQESMRIIEPERAQDERKRRSRRRRRSRAPAPPSL